MRYAIETRHLKIFAAVYRLKSFTRAAETLHTSQPTVSEHIQNLEAQLNCRLFDRLGRTILPTEEANLLYAGTQKILSELELLKERVTGNSRICGPLLIGASTVPGTYILPYHAAAFKKKYPDISFEVRIDDSTEIIREVANNELALGVVGTNQSNPKVQYTLFAQDQLVLTAPAEAPPPDPVDTQRLLTLPLVQRELGSGTRKSYEALLKEKGVMPSQLKICATLGSNTAVKEAVKAKLGLAILSRHAIAKDLAQGSLVEVPITDLPMPRNFFIVTSTRRTLPRPYQLFCTQLQEEQQ